MSRLAVAYFQWPRADESAVNSNLIRENVGDLAWITLSSSLLDDLAFYLPLQRRSCTLFQILDAVCTVGFSLPDIFPSVLIACALL
jgi:hypothetical protein